MKRRKGFILHKLLIDLGVILKEFKHHAGQRLVVLDFRLVVLDFRRSGRVLLWWPATTPNTPLCVIISWPYAAGTGLRCSGSAGGLLGASEPARSAGHSSSI
jgi:hypothetical protein